MRNRKSRTFYHFRNMETAMHLMGLIQIAMDLTVDLVDLARVK